MIAKENICPRCGSENTGLREHGANKYAVSSSTIDIDRYQEEWFCYDCNEPFFQLFAAIFVGQSLISYTGKDIIWSDSVQEKQNICLSLLNRIKMGDSKEAEELLVKLQKIFEKEVKV
jgi:hypothetical protein